MTISEIFSKASTAGIESHFFIQKHSWENSVGFYAKFEGSRDGVRIEVSETGRVSLEETIKVAWEKFERVVGGGERRLFVAQIQHHNSEESVQHHNSEESVP